ncbi:1-phosphatidylinositol 4,5-bisphosphate phosphodiesterase beta-2 [Oncorhynchus tshawytscha]|uniref:1-phosphatidylinositol 4,5-bisphosphate phosphodiesterase n=1 Tax=Oncorhynchus tshawytscha TaxID=74940 RepID=A0AAZ3PGK9_ONCTS|nr:1-phosphatidylinositol 4,5-bisphosphate phosphodiesterase beta-2 [Oncorhynchus tshawytscha]
MDKRRYTLEPPEVKLYLVKGDRFTKWSEESTKTVPVTMKMDPKGYYLYWTNQSKETEFLDVANIRDTRSGKYAKLPKHPKVRNVFNLDFPNSDHLVKTLTVVTGPDMVNLTYHNFFAYKEKVTQNWAADILSIAYNPSRNNACRQVFMEKMYVRISLQTNKDGKIPVKNIYKMFPADKKRVEGALASAHLPKGKGDTMKPDIFTEAAFKLFLMSLCPRPEIYEIFTSYSAKAKPYMTKESLAKFVNEKQRDSRLNEELFPRFRPDQVKALIEKYEPCSSNSNRGQISPEGLLFYLMGPETSVVILDKLAKCQDMSQPLPHYLIKSSHNTYLTAGQFSGVSSPEMYRQCLLAGCRCLELDCWKGKPPDEEPIITHGFTMTTEILFKDVIEAIAESAFKTSQYPVILSFENHVDSVKQQEKMANYCKTIFGDMLLMDPLDKYPMKPGLQIPSPAELMGKILIKNKKGSHGKPSQACPKKTEESEQPIVTASAGQEPNQTGPTNPEDQCVTEGEMTMTGEEVTLTGEEVTMTDDHEEQQEDEDQDEEKMKNSDEGTAGQEVTAYEEMSAIVNYIQPTKFISFDNSRKKNKSYLISSFVETKGESMISKTAVEFVEYNKRQMSRIYPKGTRMDSSNYSPQPFWNAGCQMVALNYQTMDFPMQHNMSLFEFNGRTGYLLKHDLLRRSDKKFDPYCERIDTIVANTLTIKIYSGQFLSDKSVKTGVEVEIIGLPGDPKKKYRTRWSTTPNAINPVWNEEPFVFEKILLPDMASLRVVVHEEGGKFLGHRIIPIEALQSGFQHICLRSESNMPLTLPALFVYIEVKDYIPAAFADFTDALFNPTKNSEKTTKTTESSADYISPYEMPLVNVIPTVGEKATYTKREPETKAPSPVEEADTTTGTQDTPPTPEEAPPEPEPNMDSPSPANTISVEAEPIPIIQPSVVGPIQSVEHVTEPEALPNTPDVDPEAAIATELTPDPKVDSTTCTDPNSNVDPTPNVDSTLDVNSNVVPTPDPDVESTPVADPAIAPVPPSEPSSSDPAPEDSTPPDDNEEPSTVPCEELLQHKSFLKVTKRQEKDMKELEKKFQKKGEELIQKYSDTFKALKKKNSMKKKEVGGETAEPGPRVERVMEQKERLQVELKALWVEQCDQLKKRKEQHATERLAKLLEMATERHISELNTLASESKEARKKGMSKRSGSDKARLKRAMSVDLAEESAKTDTVSTDSSPQQDALVKRQTATLDEIKGMANQLNQEALAEYEKKIRSLPVDLREAVNVCVGAHFPEQIDQAGEKQQDGVCFYGNVFLG